MSKNILCMLKVTDDYLKMSMRRSMCYRVCINFYMKTTILIYVIILGLVINHILYQNINLDYNICFVTIIYTLQIGHKP